MRVLPFIEGRHATFFRNQISPPTGSVIAKNLFGNKIFISLFDFLGLNHQNPTVERTAKEVKKKWENLATLARKEIAEFRNGAGRSLLRPPSALTLKILELIDDISFNPPSSSFDGTAVVKEEIWDDDTGSAEMSPSMSTTTTCNNNNVDESTFMTIAATGSSSFSQQSSYFSNESSSTTPPTATASTNDLIPYEPPAPLPVQTPSASRPMPPLMVAANSSYTLKRARTPTASSHDQANNEMTSLKKRKLYLESEKLELENEKLRIELEILRMKLNSLKNGARLDDE